MAVNNLTNNDVVVQQSSVSVAEILNGTMEMFSRYSKGGELQYTDGSPFFGYYHVIYDPLNTEEQILHAFAGEVVDFDVLRVINHNMNGTTVTNPRYTFTEAIALLNQTRLHPVAPPTTTIVSRTSPTIASTVQSNSVNMDVSIDLHDCSDFGINDGIAAITINGGNGPYTIIWKRYGSVVEELSQYTNDAFITDLPAGVYSVSVTDKSAQFQFIQFEISSTYNPLTEDENQNIIDTILDSVLTNLNIDNNITSAINFNSTDEEIDLIKELIAYGQLDPQDIINNILIDPTIDAGFQELYTAYISRLYDTPLNNNQTSRVISGGSNDGVVDPIDQFNSARTAIFNALQGANGIFLPNNEVDLYDPIPRNTAGFILSNETTGSAKHLLNISAIDSAYDKSVFKHVINTNFESTDALNVLGLEEQLDEANQKFDEANDRYLFWSGSYADLIIRFNLQASSSFNDYFDEFQQALDLAASASQTIISFGLPGGVIIPDGTFIREEDPIPTVEEMAEQDPSKVTTVVKELKGEIDPYRAHYLVLVTPAGLQKRFIPTTTLVKDPEDFTDNPYKTVDNKTTLKILLNQRKKTEDDIQIFGKHIINAIPNGPDIPDLAKIEQERIINKFKRDMINYAFTVRKERNDHLRTFTQTATGIRIVTPSEGDKLEPGNIIDIRWQSSPKFANQPTWPLDIYLYEAPEEIQGDDDAEKIKRLKAKERAFGKVVVPIAKDLLNDGVFQLFIPLLRKGKWKLVVCMPASGDQIASLVTDQTVSLQGNPGYDASRDGVPRLGATGGTNFLNFDTDIPGIRMSQVFTQTEKDNLQRAHNTSTTAVNTDPFTSYGLTFSGLLTRDFENKMSNAQANEFIRRGKIYEIYNEIEIESNVDNLSDLKEQAIIQIYRDVFGLTGNFTATTGSTFNTFDVIGDAAISVSGSDPFYDQYINSWRQFVQTSKSKLTAFTNTPKPSVDNWKYNNDPLPVFAPPSFTTPFTSKTPPFTVFPYAAEGSFGGWYYQQYYGLVRYQNFPGIQPNAVAGNFIGKDPHRIVDNIGTNWFTHPIDEPYEISWKYDPSIIPSNTKIGIYAYRFGNPDIKIVMDDIPIDQKSIWFTGNELGQGRWQLAIGFHISPYELYGIKPVGSDLSQISSAEKLQMIRALQGDTAGAGPFSTFALNSRFYNPVDINGQSNSYNKSLFIEYMIAPYLSPTDTRDVGFQLINWADTDAPNITNTGLFGSSTTAQVDIYDWNIGPKCWGNYFSTIRPGEGIVWSTSISNKISNTNPMYKYLVQDKFLFIGQILNLEFRRGIYPNPSKYHSGAIQVLKDEYGDLKYVALKDQR